ncbi:MAG: ABC transporter ATP-binding protein [Planctomycetota bacterium]
METNSPLSGVVKLDDVNKRFGSITAMDHINFEIPAGNVFALLGENGAGKTTTIRTILGLETPDTGTVSVLGMNPVRDGVEIRRQIGYVPDEPKLYDWMKVSEIAWFAGGFYPKGFVEEFKKIAGELELPMDVKIKTLSKGGRAKVALALAMSHRPDLLILDEPTSGLDTLVRRKFLESMIGVAAEGRTVLLCSHQIPEVERVADYVAIVNEGQVRVCERLDVLKQEMEQWVITLDNPNLTLPSFDRFKLLHEGAGERRQQLTVRAPDPNALWELRDLDGVTEVEVHIPSLEEIFVAYLQSDSIETTQPTPPANAGKQPPLSEAVNRSVDSDEQGA